jgi:hypothetical protein
MKKTNSYSNLHDHILHAPKPSSPLPNLSNVLNLPVPGENKQTTRHDGEGLPSTSSLKKSSSKSKKEPIEEKKEPIEEIIPPIVNARNLPPALPQPVHTLMSLNPRATRRTKFTKKSKGGKNKTKKRKAKKNKKNKK